MFEQDLNFKASILGGPDWLLQVCIFTGLNQSLKKNHIFLWQEQLSKYRFVFLCRNSLPYFPILFDSSSSLRRKLPYFQLRWQQKPSAGGIKQSYVQNTKSKRRQHTSWAPSLKCHGWRYSKGQPLVVIIGIPRKICHHIVYCVGSHAQIQADITSGLLLKWQIATKVITLISI